MKSEFITTLRAECVDDGLWDVIDPLRYYSEIYGGIIEAQAGWRTDLASVPRVPIIYEMFGNRAHHESVIHDLLYGTHLVDRATADAIFLEAMKVRMLRPEKLVGLKGIAELTYKARAQFVMRGMYTGVRIGGWNSYRTGPERAAKLNSPKK